VGTRLMVEVVAVCTADAHRRRLSI
jgi:hypothetical protein